MADNPAFVEPVGEGARYAEVPLPEAADVARPQAARGAWEAVVEGVSV